MKRISGEEMEYMLPTGVLIVPPLPSLTVILTFEERYLPCHFGAKFLYMSYVTLYT